MVMAVNGRQRISTQFSAEDDPYFGNTILYSLASASVRDLRDAVGQDAANICNIVSGSHSRTRINLRHIAEVYSLVERVDDYRQVFVGWDLFNSRDLTVTSWANLDLYGIDFGMGLGTPEFVRVPYSEADGVVIILPKRPVVSAQGSVDVLDVVVMLRKDDMDVLEQDGLWADS
jgi:hypothetical protein